MNAISSVRRDIQTTGAAGIALLLLVISVVLNRYRVEFVPLRPQLEHFATLIAFGILLWLLYQKRAQIAFQWSDLALAAYLFIALVSSLLFPTDQLDSVQYWARMVAAVVVYFVTRWLIRATNPATALRFATKLLLLFGVAEALFGIFAWFLYPLGMNLGVDQYPIGVRGPHGVVCNFSLTMYGTLWEPNVFGSSLATIILIAATLFVSKEFAAWRKTLGIAIAIMLVALALNASRASIGALALGILMILFFVGGMSFMEKLKWATAAALVLVIVSVPSLELSKDLMQLPTAPGLADREVCAKWIADGMPHVLGPGDTAISPATGPESGPTTVRRLFEEQTLNSRIVGYRAAWDEIVQRPLFGNGANSFGQHHTTTAHTPDWISNVFLMALHDTGIFGLAILVAWLAWFAWTIFSAWRSAPPSALRSLVLALGIGLVCLFVTYQLTTMLWFGFVWWYFAVLLAGAKQLPRDPLRGTISLPAVEPSR
ncbi:MAG TPA: O-antigen ligase family protein [Anaerolineae bacterium]|nr:O-antigen ligase family protein [Anaerolineae bacterium]